ncbi:hypothetical protein VVR12_06790 [Rothia sp. LK2588]|uniref:hypothetical protein n=1 Tax=Rothia sp. LK2588 TaxID=3114369 RepID=UPI0034CFE769
MTHLPTLAVILEDHSASIAETITVTAEIVRGSLTHMELSDENGEPMHHQPLSSQLRDELTRLVDAGEISENCQLRLQTVPEPSTSPASQESPESAAAPVGDPGDLDSVVHVNNDGLAMRAALITLGHRHGYTDTELREVSTRAGESLPEIRFFRSLVREGRVVQGDHENVVASPLQADFGAARFQQAEMSLPAPSPTDVVQPLLTHEGWVELAHDDHVLYAVDAAPGASGEIGQVIGRSATEPQVPYLVARSLGQFITGDWVSPNLGTANSQKWVATMSVEESDAGEKPRETSEESPAETPTEGSENKGEGNAEDPIAAYERYRAQIAAQNSADSIPQENLEATQDEEAILNLQYELETHNADKLNETERHLADDFAAIAFGKEKTRREESATGDSNAPVDQDRRRPAETEGQPETRAEQRQDPITEALDESASARRAASDRDTARANQSGFMASLRKFFTGE